MALSKSSFASFISAISSSSSSSTINGDSPYSAKTMEGRRMFPSFPAQARLIFILRRRAVSGTSASSHFIFGMIFSHTFLFALYEP